MRRPAVQGNEGALRYALYCTCKTYAMRLHRFGDSASALLQVVRELRMEDACFMEENRYL